MSTLVDAYVARARTNPLLNQEAFGATPGTSEAALFKAHEIFITMTHNTISDPHNPSKPQQTPEASSKAARKGRASHGQGLARLYEAGVQLMAAITTLHTFVHERASTKTKKKVSEQSNAYHQTMMRTLAIVICAGPAGIFNTTSDRRNIPNQISFSLLEFCRMVAEKSSPQDPGNPLLHYSPLGNLRAHWICMLDKMGFGAGKTAPIDWRHVVGVFHEENNTIKLANLVTEDLVLKCDPYFTDSPVASLTLQSPPLPPPIEPPPYVGPSGSS